MKNKVSIFLLLLLLVSCSHVPEMDEEKLREIREETAFAAATQTCEALPTDTPTPTPIPTNTPEPTATAFIIPTADESLITREQETETPLFPDKAQYGSMLPSPNQFTPGQNFYVTWEIKNIGTSSWTGAYTLYHSDGYALTNQETYPIDTVVAPGETLTLSMYATAPMEPGNYQTTWSIKNPDGIFFYSIYYNFIVGENTYITALPEGELTATPSAEWWMCTDPERSLIRGNACEAYCNPDVIRNLNQEGKTCYVNGVPVQ